MSIIIFIIVLSLLIFIHELGHFLVAKKSGIRVDEFAIGFPPRIFSFKKGGTRYALNLIPFGGYVKIFGENPEEGASEKSAKDSMINKPKIIQAAVLVAGVVFNIILAFVIFIILFVKGSEFSSTLVPFVPEKQGVLIEYVTEGSIVEKAGIKEGDIVKSVQVEGSEVTTENNLMLEKLYAENKNKTTILVQNTNNITRQVVLNPDSPDTKFGFSLSNRVFVKEGPIKATGYAALATVHMTKLTAIGLFDFFGKLFTGNANFKEVAGPVGIVGLVGKAAENGLNSVLLLTAIISINLAVLNLLPFPALDGGRLVVVLIEAIRRKDLNYNKVAIINTVGFFLLIGLMILLTFHDIKNLF